jgi:hypothetical protein
VALFVAGSSKAQDLDKLAAAKKPYSGPVVTRQVARIDPRPTEDINSKAARGLPAPKGAPTCNLVTVAPGALSSFVFEDDFEGGDTGGWQTPSGASFSVRGVADLSLGVQLQGFQSEALLRFDLTSPKGHHFQSLESPIVVASPANAFGTVAQSRNLPGYPHPLTVRFVTSADDSQDGTEGAAQVVSMPWPIAGTHVVNHGLYGAWTLSATLSTSSPETGAQTISCPAAQFTLTP